MKYLRVSLGEGLLKIDDFDPCPAQYTIGYWEAVDGTIVATGHVASLPEAMIAAERAGSVALSAIRPDPSTVCLGRVKMVWVNLLHRSTRRWDDPGKALAAVSG